MNGLSLPSSILARRRCARGLSHWSKDSGRNARGGGRVEVVVAVSDDVVVVLVVVVPAKAAVVGLLFYE